MKVKKAPIEDNWRLLAVVTSTGQISINLMEDLKRLTYSWYMASTIWFACPVGNLQAQFSTILRLSSFFHFLRYGYKCKSFDQDLRGRNTFLTGKDKYGPWNNFNEMYFIVEIETICNFAVHCF